MREQKLEPFIRVARTPEAGELAHRPEAAAVAGGVNAARVRIFTRHAQLQRSLRRNVERRVQRIDLAGGVGEADIAQLAACITTTPLGQLGAKSFELVPCLAAIVAQPPEISRRRHGPPWLPV